jgi:hypothetical protein
MKQTTRLYAILSISLPLAACAPGKPAQNLAEQSLSSIGCKTSQSQVWSALQSVVDDHSQFPSEAQLRSALLEVGKSKNLKGQAFEDYVEAFLNYYQTTISGIQAGMAPNDTGAWKKALAEMEVGVRVTDVHAALQDKVQAALSKMEAAESELNASCSQPDEGGPIPYLPPALPGTVWEQLKTQNPEVTGILKTFATAYQSCDVLQLPVMSSATSSAQGISIIGDHPAGGKKRAISNLALLNSTHYYVHNQRLAKNSCFEVRKSPMIYDFGGKPNTVASVPNELNMFKDGGSGTSVLGIDCSAFVFSSLALAGLKMDPDPKKVLKADLVHGIGSVAYKEPQSNGLRCLDKIKVTKDVSVAPGDIIAINGHVNIIDSVGRDPFGLARAATVADCTTAKLTSSGFDFVIAQSSPSKGGIGINRYAARDYLNESSTFKTGLTAYAVAACRAKFGASSTVSSPNLSVIRHKRTAECQAAPLVSRNMECVDSCRAN